MKILINLLVVCLVIFNARANSPYATTISGVPLNQSATDNLNGNVPTSSTAPTVGSLATLTDATSSSFPTNHVIVGPDDGGPVFLTWDLGAAIDAAARRLDIFSLWFSDDPNADRVGFNGSLSTSGDGIAFTPIADSTYTNAFALSPGLFHNIIYNFTGTNVSNFRYLQLISSPYTFPIPPGVNLPFQPRMVEADATIRVPEPSTIALLAIGAGGFGFSVYRRTRQQT